MHPSEYVATESRPAYTCTQCSTVRPYGGETTPKDVQYQPLLQCSLCGLATRHEYDGMKAFIVDMVQRAPGDRCMAVRHILAGPELVQHREAEAQR